MVKDKKEIADEIGIGEITLNDILSETRKPGRDPRRDAKAHFGNWCVRYEDLKEGMLLKGTVSCWFWCFCRYRVHQDGLVHASQLTNKRYVKHPLEVLSVGDIVDVKVMR